MNDDAGRHVVLFVDDEEAILKSLTRLFRRKGITVLTAIGGEAAISLLEKREHTVSLIVSDQKMPGMNGAVFLEKARALCPEALRFLLTGYSEMDAIVDAVNRGEIHRYLTKPWNDEELVLQVQWGFEQYDLIHENKRLLALTRKQNKQLYDFGVAMEKKVEERSNEITEKNKELEYLNKELELNLFNTVRAFAALSEMHTPHMKGHGKRVSGFAVDMARKMGLPEDEITRIEIAAILHDIGTLVLPVEVLEKHRDNRCSREDEALYRQHPVEGQNILAFINRLDEVGSIIRHHHEQFDGQGYPDHLFENQIPLGSRIIAVADAYDRLTSGVQDTKRISAFEKTIAEISVNREALSRNELVRQATLVFIKKNVFTLFDPDVVKLFLEVLVEKGIDLARERQVLFADLSEGMVLTRPVYSANGRFLLPQKFRLNDSVIQKLKTFFNNNELIDGFFIEVK
jgi:response regulator RpfG family c-di-GMP phosphodiesterase